MKEARAQKNITDIHETIFMFSMVLCMRTFGRKVPLNEIPRKDHSMSNSLVVNSSELTSALYVPLNSFIFTYIYCKLIADVK